MVGKKVLTKVFKGSFAGHSGHTTVLTNAFEKWLMQEDNEILGCQMTIVPVAPDENDGLAFFYLELSQVGSWACDGSLMFVKSLEYWNTSPAGVDVESGHGELWFPNPISLVEGDYLYLNKSVGGKTAGTTSWDFDVIVYYRHTK